MMTRVQRIEYEILDCALNRPNFSGGHYTTVTLFMGRLQDIFPDIETREFSVACARLAGKEAIGLAFPDVGGYRDYRSADDDAELFDAETLRLAATPSSKAHFRQLSALIDAPVGFKRDSGRRP
jgi:hypothetical protein